MADAVAHPLASAPSSVAQASSGASGTDVRSVAATVATPERATETSVSTVSDTVFGALARWPSWTISWAT